MRSRDDLGALLFRLQCLNRELFTVEEAWDRLSDDDMQTHPGARLLRSVLDEV